MERNVVVEKEAFVFEVLKCSQCGDVIVAVDKKTGEVGTLSVKEGVSGFKSCRGMVLYPCLLVSKDGGFVLSEGVLTIPSSPEEVKEIDVLSDIGDDVVACFCNFYCAIEWIASRLGIRISGGLLYRNCEVSCRGEKEKEKEMVKGGVSEYHFLKDIKWIKDGLKVAKIFLESVRDFLSSEDEFRQKRGDLFSFVEGNLAGATELLTVMVERLERLMVRLNVLEEGEGE